MWTERSRFIPTGAVATVGDFKQFRNGPSFGTWLGMSPKQNSSGGKSKLGCITRRGDMYLRSLLIQGAKSAVMKAHKRHDPGQTGGGQARLTPRGIRLAMTKGTEWGPAVRFVSGSAPTMAQHGRL